MHFFLTGWIQLVNQSVGMHLINLLPGKVLNEQGRLFCQPKVEANRDEEECRAFLRGIDRAAVKDHESGTRHLFHWGLS